MSMRSVIAHVLTNSGTIASEFIAMFNLSNTFGSIVGTSIPANAITDPTGGLGITDPTGGSYITEP